MTIRDLLPYIGAALVISGVGVALSRRRDLVGRWCAWAVGVAIAGAAFAAWLVPGQLPRVLAVGVLIVALVPVLTGDAAGGLRRLTFGVLGVVWLAPLAAVVHLGATALALFVAVSLNDI